MKESLIVNSLFLRIVKKCLQNILLFIAVITVLGHSTFPHRHADEGDAIEQHHHDNNTNNDHNDNNSDSDHNIFSFAQLDNNFIPVQSQTCSLELPVIYLITRVIVYHFNVLLKQEKLHFGYYQ